MANWFRDCCGSYQLVWQCRLGPRQRTSPPIDASAEPVHEQRQRRINGREEAAHGLRILLTLRIPVHHEREVNPLVVEIEAACERSDVEARRISIAALGVCA